MVSSSNPNDDYFPVYSESRSLSSKTANSVVRYGYTRIEGSGVSTFAQEMENFPKVKHSEIELGSCIGRGVFSRVFDVVSIHSPTTGSDDRKYIAAKKKLVVKVLDSEVVDKPRWFASYAADLYKESLILSTLNHKNVIMARAVSVGDGIDAYRNGRNDAFFLVMDRLEDTLAGRIKTWQAQKTRLRLFPTLSNQALKKKSTMLQSKLDIIVQLASAIEYIHSKGIVHRDLKPDNIGFDAQGTVKVFDFDVSRVLPTEEQNHPDETFKMTQKVGSQRYMSPECFKGEPYNCKTDVYAFGLVAYSVLTSKKPFHKLKLGEEIENAVFLGGARPSIPSCWTGRLESIVKRCWSARIAIRPTMAEARETLEKELHCYFAQKTNKWNKAWPLAQAKTSPQ